MTSSSLVDLRRFSESSRRPIISWCLLLRESSGRILDWQRSILLSAVGNAFLTLEVCKKGNGKWCENMKVASLWSYEGLADRWAQSHCIIEISTPSIGFLTALILHQNSMSRFTCDLTVIVLNNPTKVMQSNVNVLINILKARNICVKLNKSAFTLYI